MPFQAGEIQNEHFERNHSSSAEARVKFLALPCPRPLRPRGYNYIPVPRGSEPCQEMDTAVVKGLATSGKLKPTEVVKASIERAIADNNVPSDAYVDIKQDGASIQAHIIYSKKIPMLPFGIYKYSYNFDYVATPVGYLTKDGKS